jgi:hypothetical protein
MTEINKSENNGALHFQLTLLLNAEDGDGDGVGVGVGDVDG